MIHRTGFVDIYSKWLIFISLLFLFAPHNIPIINKVVFLLLFIILFFPIMFIKDIHTFNYSLDVPREVSNIYLYTLLALQLILGEYVSRYYTGIGLFESISQIFKGVNNYASYQSYFTENKLNEFSVQKLPAILAAAFLKGVFLYSISVYFIYKDISKPKYFLFLSIVPLALFSISRGTFFEVFEIVVCILYFYKVSNKSITSSLHPKSIKKNVYLIVCGASLVAAFSYNAARRFEDNSAFINAECLLKEMCFTPYTDFISVENAIYLLSGYFAAGMYFVTEYINILFEEKMLPSLFPFITTSIFSFDHIGIVEDLCQNYVYCGVSWQPDLFLWFSFFGFILTLFIFPFFFYMFFRVEKRFLENANLYSLPLLYLLLIYFLSVPVGNFYTASSANKLCTLFFLLLWFIKIPKKFFRNF